MAKFTMTAGDSKVLEVTVVDDDGIPVNISGTAIRFEMARFASDTPALVTKAIGSGVTIIDGPTGRFDVALDPADTAEFSGSYYYEAEIDDGGTISTVIRGRATIDAALIRP